LVQTLTKKKLEILLSQLKGIPKPKASLEQYEIPGELASQIINIAYLSRDIKNKLIADLGCGTGRLAIGSALMEAKEVTGIDIDEESIKVAEENVKIAESLTNQEIHKKIKFVQKDITDWNEEVDTIVQNPPFGIQSLHADRLFLKKALECGKKIYSLHRHYEKSQVFLKKFIEQKGGKVEKMIKFKYKIPHMFKFHRKPYVTYDVDLFIISRLR
jgi:putative methylase